MSRPSWEVGGGGADHRKQHSTALGMSISASLSGPSLPSPSSGDDTVPQAGSRQGLVGDVTVSLSPRSHVLGGAGNCCFNLLRAQPGA